MSQLFVELYLDEDVSVLVARILRSRGFTAVTTQEAGQVANSDSEQLAYAIRKNKTLLTHNRVDFEQLSQEYFRTNRNHKGLIIAIRRTPAREEPSRQIRTRRQCLQHRRTLARHAPQHSVDINAPRP